RLNDCTPTPDEQAKYADGVKDEREAQIRECMARDVFLAVDQRTLLRLLDEARAEIAEQQSEIEELAAKVGPVTERNGELRGRVRELESEIARLRAPPEADVMEIARELFPAEWNEIWARLPIHSYEELKARIARALTAYGDQRAREARAAGPTESQIHDFWQGVGKNSEGGEG
ncbi:MAG TPA: hypothetical protein VNH39_10570, partial [Steroidobacteraceae bacterium]|nr:hypothetical protein [Steroidobacteraceae bacterium]